MRTLIVVLGLGLSTTALADGPCQSADTNETPSAGLLEKARDAVLYGPTAISNSLLFALLGRPDIQRPDLKQSYGEAKRTDLADTCVEQFDLTNLRNPGDTLHR